MLDTLVMESGLSALPPYVSAVNNREHQVQILQTVPVL